MSLRDADLTFGAGRIAFIAILGTSLALSGCGGDSASNISPSGQTYSLSGTERGRSRVRFIRCLICGVPHREMT
jgi:hypothetical protein